MKWFALDAAAMGDIDFSGADSLRQVAAEMERRQARLVICSLDPSVRKLVDAYGLTDKIGTEYIFDTAQDVMAAYRKLTNAT